MELVIDRSLSFSLSTVPPSGIDDICLFSEKKGKYYIQAPKIDKLKEILSTIGIKLVLNKSGEDSYGKLKKVSVDRVSKQVKVRGNFVAKLFYTITFPEYPSSPKFARGVNYWRWANLGRKVSEKGERPVYDVEHPYCLVEVMEWLRREGYDVSISKVASESLAKPSDSLARIQSMKMDPELEIKPYQEEDVNAIEKMGYKGVIGTDPGLGKTIEAGKIIKDLFDAGKLNRLIWVVPTSHLVHQVLEEMKSRFGMDGTGITADLVDRETRLGLDEDGNKKYPTVYEKFGFVVVTWATFVMDWTGDTFEQITHSIWFDLGIFDEAHRAKAGKTTFSAILNCTAPYRLLLSGTIMPNGKWEELHDMVSAIAPASCMLKWYLTTQEEKLAEEYKGDPEIENPRQMAKIKITARALSMLMIHVTRHRKEEVAEFLPNLKEGTVHVQASKDEELVIQNMIEILSGVIDEWQSSLWMKKGNEKQREKYAILESAKNIVWQLTRRYCSHGAFTIRKWFDELDPKTSPVHSWLKERFFTELETVKGLIEKDGVKNQPKNEKVLFILSKIKSSRCLVFYDSIEGTVFLARYLKDNGKNVQVVVGKDISKEDARYIGQSKNMKDDDIANILEWYWFPWITVGKFSEIDGVDATYIPEQGKERKSVYYVDAHKMGSKFSIDVSFQSDDETESLIVELIKYLETGPNITVTKERNEEGGKTTFNIRVKIDKTTRDDRILVCTEKMKEGANLQVTDLMIFYDQPMSIRQREQRLGRIKRMQSMHSNVTVVSTSMGLEYSIKKNLGLKYETASKIGYDDADEVPIQGLIKSLKKDTEWKKKAPTTLLEFEEEK